MAHIDDDRGLDLLHGLLEEDDRDEVMEHLKQCPDCEARFRELVGDRERAQVELTRRLPELDQEAAARVALPQRAPSFLDRLRAAFTPSGRGRWGWAAAAGIALVALLLWPRLAPHPGGDSLRAALHRLPPVGELIPSRGADDPFSQELLAGLEAYSRDDLGLSVLLLDKAQVTGQLETLRRLYLGSALARQGEYVRAARLLRNMAITELPDPWSMEGRWTLYVALKGSGETTAADSLLTVLRQDAGELGARARAVNPS